MLLSLKEKVGILHLSIICALHCICEKEMSSYFGLSFPWNKNLIHRYLNFFFYIRNKLYKLFQITLKKCVTGIEITWYELGAALIFGTVNKLWGKDWIVSCVIILNTSDVRENTMLSNYCILHLDNTDNMNHFKENIQFIKELHRAIRKNFPGLRTFVDDFSDLCQSDFAQLDLFTLIMKY